MPKSKKSGTSVHKRTSPAKRVGREVASGAHADVEEYGSILHSLVDLLDNARRASVRSVNAIMTATYWEIGRRIVEYEQGGAERAAYGKRLIERLSADLGSQFGRGFSLMNLRQMRRFYLSWPDSQIQQTPSVELSSAATSNTSKQVPVELSLSDLAVRFPLSWSHYVTLLSVENPYARSFYEAEALRGGWSIRQLERQINSQFYYAPDGLPNKILAAEYRTALPDEQVLVHEVERTRRLLEGGREQSSTESDR